MDCAAERLGERAVGVADLGAELGGTGLERDAAPDADREAAVGALALAVIGDRGDRMAAGEELHALAGEMLDRDADDRRARIVVGRRKQPGDPRLLALGPVA